MDGIVPLLKPPGMTSSNAVYDIRRIYSEKHAGHLGTLDPGAAGVLPICIGRATRLFDYLVDKEKTYLFEVSFGVSTDTQDVFGAVTGTSDLVVSEEMLRAVLPSFLGRQMQAASVFSALKVDGKKMYDLARAGKEVEPRYREIVLSDLAYLGQTGPNRFLLSVVCSRGTYIRSLCADMGERLHGKAHMSFLLRTASGPFSIEHAYTVQELIWMGVQGRLTETLTSCEDALAFLPTLTLPEDRRTPTLNGLDTFLKGQPDGDVRLYCGGFLGIGKVEKGRVKLNVHLYDRDA